MTYFIVIDGQKMWIFSQIAIALLGATQNADVMQNTDATDSVELR